MLCYYLYKLLCTFTFKILYKKFIVKVSAAVITNEIPSLRHSDGISLYLSRYTISNEFNTQHSSILCHKELHCF